MPSVADQVLRLARHEPVRPQLRPVGFWAHVQDVYGDLWEHIQKIVEVGIHGQNQAAFDAAVADEASFLSSWGSSAFDLPGQDTNWLMSSPFPAATGPKAQRRPRHQKLSTDEPLRTKAYSTAQLKIVPRADKPLIEIHLGETAGASASNPTTSTTRSAKSSSQRREPRGMRLPTGRRRRDPARDPASLRTAARLAAGRLGGGASIRYFAPQDSSYCKPKEPKSPEEPLAPTTTTASSFGDPHLLGFGGTALEFQAAGEFTLVKSTTTDDLEVPGRQQPEALIFAVDTAVAMRVGHAVVEVDRPVNDRGISVYVNHRPVHAKSIRLAGGGSVKLLALRNAGFGGREKFPGVKVAGRTEPMSRSRRTPSVSRCCSKSRRSPRTSDGPDRRRRCPGRPRSSTGAKASRTRRPARRNEAALYRSYGASWRITQRYSLFTYPRHKNTHSYTILDFPKKHFNWGASRWPRHCTAEALCRKAGLTNLALLQACEYDVLVIREPNIRRRQTGWCRPSANPAPPVPSPPSHRPPWA